MYSLGALSLQVIEKKEEKDWFESLDYEDLNLEGSLYMYIGGGGGGGRMKRGFLKEFR